MDATQSNVARSSAPVDASKAEQYASVLRRLRRREPQNMLGHRDRNVIVVSSLAIALACGESESSEAPSNESRVSGADQSPSERSADASIGSPEDAADASKGSEVASDAQSDEPQRSSDDSISSDQDVSSDQSAATDPDASPAQASQTATGDRVYANVTAVATSGSAGTRAAICCSP